jgi:hypothetical protein
MSGFNFFAIEVAFQLYPGNPRQRMHELIVSTPTELDYTQKWNFYRNYCGLLLEAAPRFEFGVWEFSEGATAEDEYEEWCRGTQADAQASAEAAATAHNPSAYGNDPYRQGGENRYMLAMALFLIQDGSNTDAAVRKMTQIPQHAFWTRQTITSLFQGIGYINFATVKADTVFVRPGDESRALTSAELKTERYQYLRPLS